MGYRRIVAVAMMTALVGVGVVGVASAAEAGSGHNLVTDGDFEPPGLEDVGSYTTYSATAPEFGAWTITAGSIDLVGPNSDPAASGVQFVDLNGNADIGPGSIAQSIEAEEGRRYRVQFAVSGNRNGEPLIKDLAVSFGGTSRDFQFDTTAAVESSALAWETKVFDAAVCTSGTVDLVFASRTDGIRGPLIDDVSVVDVGEADTCGWAGTAWHVPTLAGLGLIWVGVAVWFGRVLVSRQQRRSSAPVSLGVGAAAQ